MNNVVKRISGSGKIRRYKNLATFNKECGKRSTRGNLCLLTNIRCTKDGGGLATVRSTGAWLYDGNQNIHTQYGKAKSGLWRLRFASCTVMKQHLKGRVDVGAGKSLDGSKRRKKRRR